MRYKEKTRMTAREARTYIRYSGWASRKVLAAALALSPEDLAKPMSVSHESIAKTVPIGNSILIEKMAVIQC